MKPTRIDLPGLPRWVATATLGAPKTGSDGGLVVTVHARVHPWRARVWIAWRILTARWTREAS